MPHIKVKRGSMSISQWAEIMFTRISEFIIEEEQEIINWKARNARYSSKGYTFEEKEHDIESGDIWGGPDITTIFTNEFKIPGHLKGKKLKFYQLSSSEVIVKINDKFVFGLDPNRKWFEIPQAVMNEGYINVKMEAYTRSKPDDDRNTDVQQFIGCVHRFVLPKLIVTNDDILDLSYDLKTIYELCYCNNVDQSTHEYLEYHIKKILKILPAYDCSKAELFLKVPIIKKYIEEKVYGNEKIIGKKGSISLIGHSHLDLAYHWTIDQTIQKNARTSLIQLNLMRKYPEYKFAQSQAYLYETLEIHYPEIFQEVKQRIIEKRWEIVGAMYVEPDCNLINSESFIRQILYGKAYFKNKFNVDVNNIWLPDVFGLSCLLPQIMKGCSVDYLVSHKLSVWNDTNKFPYNHFWWRGLDGSQVKVCMPPVHFVSWMDPELTIENWENFSGKNYSPASMQVFGYGDGGSGPTEEMLEIYRRQEKLPGIPYQKIERADDFLNNAFKNGEDLPSWEGDLYLEMHRGTYTTKAKLKKLNRKYEYAIRFMEILMTVIGLKNNMGNRQKEIERIYKKILTNQFHDILPGSHTYPVYLDALATYEQIEKLIESQIEDCFENISVEKTNNYFFAFNSQLISKYYLAFIYDEGSISEKLKAGKILFLKDMKGNYNRVELIRTAEGEEKIITSINEINQIGFENFEMIENKIINKTETNEFNVTTKKMENRFFRIVLTDKGKIRSIYDKIKNREIVLEGKEINDWHIYEDKPGALNAWNIQSYYKDHEYDIEDWQSIEIQEDGCLCKSIKMVRPLLKGKAVQIIRIFKDKPQIDFDTWIDWKDEEKILKVSFPLNIKGQSYSVDTSLGTFERGLRKNTSFEKATYEVPVFKFVDLTDGRYGVSIMNDCKYGCDVDNQTISLTLIKSPIYPDSTSDQEEHTFTYSLYIHDGLWQESQLYPLAIELNNPLVLRTGKIKKEDCHEFLNVDTKGVELLALKMAEDGSNDYILRLGETYGSATKCKIKFHNSIKAVTKVNHLEEMVCENNQRLYVDKKNNVDIDMKANEIITLRIKG